ncbi:ClpP family protease [Streptomyces noursei]|uniref:ATP-dependent Clp protease proteolytic subunit n=1 Tax=Streptomyces noursei TaxID=1971 RepID=A0A401RCP6_STRNR|nr:ATP-dependent Clp protease proteolytic subunit [Streptomyces noursei]AKA07470.1 ATP-dependent Clp protease proteolytic subunit [Streptomyces noursei ZPM]EOT03630.1 ATP-dependent Clp protease proteolytic subunit [Streptomyces noursei CCRC 11814]EXU88172.1 Clp protease ClpP [Streptomyces noursei PD-1]MCZ0972136.1 ATP-dependent Clp protease proteolytic subunit [Streptomyces noursei]UWS76030.1 ATP-dependent Clp protease proteolytic subunit [Streptomyces noursei]
MLPTTARHVLPEFTERTSHGTRTSDPYSKLLSERIVFLGTPIDDACANDVMAQLVHLEHAAPERDISLYINSPGGSFTAMCAIYDTMRYVSCDVETVCLGQAVSGAAVLLAAGTPGKRLALPHARMMIHQPSLGEPVQGQADDLRIRAEELLRTRDRLTEMLAEHTGRSRERIAADIERDTFFDAPAAQEYGLIDALTRGRKRTPLLPVGR